jgi:Caulimovirus viroplasmin
MVRTKKAAKGDAAGASDQGKRKLRQVEGGVKKKGGKGSKASKASKDADHSGENARTKRIRDAQKRRKPASQRKQTYWAVKVGRVPGVYTSSDRCNDQVQGFPGAKVKKFTDRQKADAFVSDAAVADDRKKVCLPGDCVSEQMLTEGYSSLHVPVLHHCATAPGHQGHTNWMYGGSGSLPVERDSNVTCLHCRLRSR